jgi:4-hydroxybenzoate polyprenyltransferase
MYLLNSKRININVLNLVKNSIQYLVGTVLYFIIFNKLSLDFILGLAGFLIAYHSVYQFNDLMDYKEDIKNKFKLKIKLLPRGDVKREYVESYTFLFAVVGLVISFLVNNFFGLLVATCLFLNFLHSSSFIRLKNSKLLLPNLFFIEFIKYSLGWFALTGSISEFPFFLITFLSLVYLMGYIFWKQNISNFLTNNKIKILLGISATFYLISFFIYSFKLALILPIACGFVFLLFKKNKSSIIRLKIGYTLVFVISFCFLLSLILITTPSVAEINNKIINNVDNIKKNISEVIPQNVKNEIDSINKTIKDNINKINDFKESISLK